jgi:hypothetical protein
MMRPNELEGLSLKTLSSQVLTFEARPEPTQLEHLSYASFLGKLLVLPANVRPDWKVIVRYKRTSLLGLIVSNEGKMFYNIDTWTSATRRPGTKTGRRSRPGTGFRPEQNRDRPRRPVSDETRKEKDSYYPSCFLLLSLLFNFSLFSKKV